MKEALEVWDQQLMQLLLPRQYRMIEDINQALCSHIRRAYPQDEAKVRELSILENNTVRMSHLAIVGSHSVNGVAKLHSNILQQTVFPGFHALYPGKFSNITNGISQRRWLFHCNPELTAFITERIGNAWLTDFSHIARLAEHASDRDTQQQFLEIKRHCKKSLLTMLQTSCAPRGYDGTPLPADLYADETFLFDAQVKRIHEYKRQLLNILHVIARYQHILDNPASSPVKRLVLFSGKAAANYVTAKAIIRLINAVARKVNNDVRVQSRLSVCYVENYNVSKAEVIFPASDLSEQISTAGCEASGTGNMKFAMNGALTIGTEDGANIEMRQHIGDRWWPFRFGASAEQLSTERALYRPRRLYETQPDIARILNTLTDRSFATNAEEHEAFCGLFNTLLDAEHPDPFFVLYDLQQYLETQNTVDTLYAQPFLWAEYALHNIAGMGYFSSDRAIQEYSTRVWHISPVPVSEECYRRIYAAYASLAL